MKHLKKFQAQDIHHTSNMMDHLSKKEEMMILRVNTNTITIQIIMMNLENQNFNQIIIKRQSKISRLMNQVMIPMMMMIL